MMTSLRPSPPARRLASASQALLATVAAAIVFLAAARASAEPATGLAVAPEGTPKPLTALKADLVGQTVTLVGKISNRIEPNNPESRAPHRWYVTDGEGVALVVLFSDDYRRLGDVDSRFPVGAMIQIKGKISLYRGALQLVPGNAADVQLAAPDSPQGLWGAAPAPAAATSAAPGAATAPPKVKATLALPDSAPEGYLFPAKATKDLLDQTIKVAGRVAKFRASWSDTAPNILTLEGGNGTLDIVFWKDIDGTLGGRKDALITIGNFVKAEGKLTEFRERLQLRIDKGDDLQAWTVAPPAEKAATAGDDKAKDAGMKDAQIKDAVGEREEPATSSAKDAAPAAFGDVRSPSQITKDDLDKTLAVRGAVKAVKESTADNVPTRVTLVDDEGGSIIVVFWSDTAERFRGENAPQIGKTWAVEGKIGEFRGDLQIRASAVVK